MFYRRHAAIMTSQLAAITLPWHRALSRKFNPKIVLCQVLYFACRLVLYMWGRKLSTRKSRDYQFSREGIISGYCLLLISLVFCPLKLSLHLKMSHLFYFMLNIIGPVGLLYGFYRRKCLNVTKLNICDTNFIKVWINYFAIHAFSKSAPFSNCRCSV